MPHPRTVRVGRKALRTVVGDRSRVERLIKRRYLSRRKVTDTTESGPGWYQHAGRSFVIVGDSSDFPEPRRGIALRGGCDLPSAFTAVELMRDGLEGSVLISRDRTQGTGSHASSQIVQSLAGVPPEKTVELRSRLQIGEEQFEPSFFGPTVAHPRTKRYGSFPRNVVVMSAATDVVRTLYRHRTHGYVVDPGGWWLHQDVGEVLGNQENIEWFRKEFRKIGKISIEDYIANMETIVTELRARAGAEVIVFSALVVDPKNPTHNYQLVRQPSVTRRREFHIALMDLSKRLNFHVVDVDRVLKRDGVEEQVDFAHFTAEGMKPVGAEFYRVLRQLEIV